MSNKGVCGTTPATPGLLKIENIVLRGWGARGFLAKKLDRGRPH